MITIEKNLDFQETYPLSHIGKPEELLFFDIETTGFSGQSSYLYLIGCIWFSKGRWQLIQWFADTLQAESEILHTFFRFLKNFRTIIHFNGDGFDIPFLTKRCQALSLPYDFSCVQSLDIYKKIRPYRRILGLESLKQKAIEHFLGIHRTDTCTGGQLIQVYLDYLNSHDHSLYQLLLLHNEDDLKGMPTILPVLCYPDFLENPFTLLSCELSSHSPVLEKTEESLILNCSSPYTVPISFSSVSEHISGFSLHGKGNRLFLSIPLFTGTLRHFFPNYRDYYYLIFEDTAVHKSVGEYVDRAARRQATASTCYIKKEGCFLPQFESIFSPELKKEKRDKLSYAEYQEGIFDDKKRLNQYIKHIIAHF
ncbi:ribonuclease H-like domain-containing protein [Lachnospiraceae bacterium 62-35]